jgi:hypothetical protein
MIILVLTIVFGVLVSVSVNAQSGAAKTFRKKDAVKANACRILERKRTQVESTARRSRKVRETSPVLAKTSAPAIALNAPAGSSIIREIVYQRLRETEVNSPIELSPLQFAVEGDHLRVKDAYPFLFAVEFALQGRTIRIENQDINSDQAKDSSKALLVAEIIRNMKERGVPAERISVVEAQNPPTAEGFNAVYLTVL